MILLSSLALACWWGEKVDGIGPEDKERRLSWLMHHTRMQRFANGFGKSGAFSSN